VPSADRRHAAPPALAAALLWPLLLAACGGTFDDLFPSSADHSGGAAGTTGPAVGQTAPDFALPDTLPAAAGAAVTLSGALAGKRAAVLYFVMWCPICDEHMMDLAGAVIPAFPDVAFLALDYVSGSVAQSWASRQAAGWGGPDFTVLFDAGAATERYYQRGMGVVVIDAAGVVRMNGAYQRQALQAVLEALP
jgi:peroxiredoxin